MRCLECGAVMAMRVENVHETVDGEVATVLFSHYECFSCGYKFTDIEVVGEQKGNDEKIIDFVIDRYFT